MITKLYIDNFKSLVEFELLPDPRRLSPFACLIGLNGSGKSTLLQAFDFLGQLVVGRISDWLEEREWKPSELLTQVGRSGRNQEITFKVHFKFNGTAEIVWHGRFN